MKDRRPIEQTFTRLIAQQIGRRSGAEIRKHGPLRLDVAAALAFPDGFMTVSSLRKEAAMWARIAGKDYTTCAAIEQMRELCRHQRSAIVA
jgi:hypothetical protein